MTDPRKAKPPGDCGAWGRDRRANADTFTLFSRMIAHAPSSCQSPKSHDEVTQ